jgi:hypothetical protein
MAYCPGVCVEELRNATIVFSWKVSCSPDIRWSLLQDQDSNCIPQERDCHTILPNAWFRASDGKVAYCVALHQRLRER